MRRLFLCVGLVLGCQATTLTKEELAQRKAAAGPRVRAIQDSLGGGMMASLVKGVYHRLEFRAHEDKFDRVMRESLSGNDIPYVPDDPAAWRMSSEFDLGTRLDAVAVTREGHRSYALSVQYNDARDWLFIESGESLILLVDGERLALQGSGSEGARNVWDDATISEYASYPVAPETLVRIAWATTLEYKLVGSKGDDSGKVPDLTQMNLRSWIGKHVPEARSLVGTKRMKAELDDARNKLAALEAVDLRDLARQLDVLSMIDDPEFRRPQTEKTIDSDLDRYLNVNMKHTLKNARERVALWEAILRSGSG
jgi:hypothetical protein